MARLDRRDGPALKALLRGPIFLENPDGSIAEAIPSSVVEAKLKGARRSDRPGAREGSDSDGSLDSRSSAVAAVNMAQEVDQLYTRHERIFMVLVVMQFLLEALYTAVFVTRMRPSVVEFVAMYNWEISPKAAEVVLWMGFVVQVVYSIVYYCLAVVSVWTKKPKNYQRFGTCCLTGVMGLVLMAYLDKFNLPIFFLRLLAFIYARFLQGLTASLVLLPPVRQPQQTV